ncbi:hypothetical protein BaRGS_00000278 [Batillaria attramentaria]|uniref:Uncharacterized protein n=1 Tax=Batillaria attramentaria TaxID=370345 RepID=A0ABD0MAC9_9CAEN
MMSAKSSYGAFGSGRFLTSVICGESPTPCKKLSPARAESDVDYDVRRMKTRKRGTVTEQIPSSGLSILKALFCPVGVTKSRGGPAEPTKCFSVGSLRLTCVGLVL